MRVYVIGNDGITLCREPPAAVNDGEIAVASIGRHTNCGLPGASCIAPDVLGASVAI
jgi:hypothetical protein